MPKAVDLLAEKFWHRKVLDFCDCHAKNGKQNQELKNGKFSGCTTGFGHAAVAMLHAAVAMLHAAVAMLHAAVAMLHAAVAMLHAAVAMLHAAVAMLDSPRIFWL